MLTTDFSRFAYTPSILCDPVGEIAYARLAEETKMGILPIFELTWRPWASDFEKPLAFLSSLQSGHPYLLDIDKRRAPDPYLPMNPRDPAAAKREFERKKAAQLAFNGALNRLLRPGDGFLNWRRLINLLPGAIPVLQLTNVTAQREEFIRQLELLAATGASIGFRISLAAWDALSSLAGEVLLNVRDVSQVLIIIDLGQGRVMLPRKIALVEAALERIEKKVGRSRMEKLHLVCMSNSFTLPQHKGIRFKENLDREIWWRTTRRIPMARGDYAATQRDNSHSSFRPWDYRAAITHSTPGGWLVSRHANKNDPLGWVDACKEIEADDRFKPLHSWCDQTIKSTADVGELGSEDPRAWHATRINGHVERFFAEARR